MFTADALDAARALVHAAMPPTPQQRGRWAGRCIGLTLSGGNVDSAVFAQVLGGG